MKKHHWQIGALIFLLVLIAVFVLSITRTQDGAVPKKVAAEDVPFMPASVVLKDSYSTKTSHTISGSVTVPTPCYTVAAKGQVDTSKDPQVIRIDLTIPTDTGMCLQLATAKTFSVPVTAPKSATVVVYVNGAVASTTAK